MILLEQQYMVNDVVKIDDVTGQVERITLRMTVLRDLEGHVHFIPHGEVNRVSNSTHGWSRAMFNVGRRLRRGRRPRHERARRAWPTKCAESRSTTA